MIDQANNGGLGSHVLEVLGIIPQLIPQIQITLTLVGRHIDFGFIPAVNILTDGFSLSLPDKHRLIERAGDDFPGTEIKGIRHDHHHLIISHFHRQNQKALHESNRQIGKIRWRFRKFSLIQFFNQGQIDGNHGRGCFIGILNVTTPSTSQLLQLFTDVLAKMFHLHSQLTISLFSFSPPSTPSPP